MGNIPIPILIDVGELGWSLYLSAYARWCKQYGRAIRLIITMPGRECLYKNLIDTIMIVSDDFYKSFDVESQNRFTLFGVSGKGLKAYFNNFLSDNYCISDEILFDCNDWRIPFKNQMIFAAYPYEKEIKGKREILIFPRIRTHTQFCARNLPKAFYIKLITVLCDIFKDRIIRTMGTLNGAYNITEVKESNYINFIGKTSDIQDVIDRCQVATVAIGSQSAPLKLMLIQSTPTFMIGHEKTRHIHTENWKQTKVDFCEISNYAQFNFDQCINQIVTFVGGCL